MPAAVKAVKAAVKPAKTAVKTAVKPVKTAAKAAVKTTAKPVKTAVKTTAKPVQTDAIDLLINDHQVVAGLFEQFEKAGQRAFKTKQNLVQKIAAELTTHTYIEETIFYPEARAAVPATKDHVLESIEEHHLVVWMLAELSAIDPADERFDAKVTVLIENVRHHVEEEEKEWFPQVRKAMKAEQLQELGLRLAAAKADAPGDPLAVPSAKA
jgi:hemerythrin superfamily protein